MSLDQVANFVKVTLSTGYDDFATSIVLTTGHGSRLPDPASRQYNLVWWNATDYPDPADDPNVEIVRVTAKTSDTITATRAQEGTSASTKNAAGKTYKMLLGLTKKMIDDLSNFAGGGTPVENEVVPGSGTSWTLANTPISGSVKLWAGGIRLTPGAGNDYTISGATITTAANYGAGALLADYRK